VKPVDDSKPKSAQSAILEYYDDMLGSLGNDPLQKLVQEEQKVVASTIEKTILPKRKAKQPLQLGQRKTQQVKMQSHQLPVTFYDEGFEEKLKTDVVAPLIIPAAFPKLSPKIKSVDSEVKQAKIEQEKPIKKNSPIIETTEPEIIKEAVGVNKTISNVKPKGIIVSKSEVPKVVLLDKKPSSNHLDKKDKLLNSSKLKNDLSESNLSVGWLENGRPTWAKERFECLLFSVAGLQLAVPLVSLGAIYKIENDFTPLIGRASWFMGLYRHDGRNVRVIDTAQLVMPDRVTSTTRENYRYIIRLGGNNWGIACDSVQEAIQLEPSEVKWRTERSKRAWLSGTVIEHMCALLDADTLSQMLNKEAVSKHSSFF